MNIKNSIDNQNYSVVNMNGNNGDIRYNLQTLPLGYMQEIQMLDIKKMRDNIQEFKQWPYNDVCISDIIEESMKTYPCMINDLWDMGR